MEVYDLKINGIKEPLGFELPYVTISWKVKGTFSKVAIREELIVSDTPDFSHILYSKKETSLRRIGEDLPISLLPRTRYYVCVKVEGNQKDQASLSTWFETGKMQEAFAASWIASPKEEAIHPLFFKDFVLNEKPVRARLYCTGLGLYEAYLNQEKVGEEFLTPYCNDYNEGVQVQTYDITDHLVAGQNTLSMICGNGWYKGRLGYEGAKEVYGDQFQVLAEVRMTFADGSEKVLGTDDSWQYRASDFVYSDIYDGEELNRLLYENKDNLARPVVKGLPKTTVDRYSLPVIIKDSLPVKVIIHTPAGETVLDFGQNFTGYVEYTAALPKGTRIVLDHGEILQNGNFYNDNYRTAKAKMIYVSNGTEETVRAHFTYFGFRYVRVTGWPGEIKKEDFTGRVLYSDLETALHFDSANEKLNRLFLNSFWGQRSNFLDMPTDCPQRDERLGWTGDAQVFSPTACFQMDTRAFYRKFLKDLRLDSSKHQGAVANYLPNFSPMPSGSSVWGDIASFLPTTLYETYGDLNALKESYPLMHDWLEWILNQDEAQGARHLWDFGFHFGDWLAQDGSTPQSMKGGTDDNFVASMYYYATAGKVAKAARLLGYDADAQKYETLQSAIHDAILREYFTPSGRLAIDTQTAYLLCLRFGVYQDKERILSGLKRRFQKDLWKIKGGFVGATMMLQVLSENGMEEEASYFLFQEGFPGWMHCINLGATTIWERWNSVLDDGSISGTGMNSLNHYSYGSVMEYVYKDMAGIQNLTPGYTRVRFAPQPTWRTRYLTVSYDSISGTYTSSWKINDDGTVTLRFEVPFGCSAEALLPDGTKKELESGVSEMTVTPLKDYRCRYSMEARLSELTEDEEALAVLKEDLPPAYATIMSGDEEFMSLSFEELKTMFFRGFNPPLVMEGTKRLFQLKAF